MTDLVTISIENHVANVHFNQPNKYNALKQDMVVAYGTRLIEELKGKQKNNA